MAGIDYIGLSVPRTYNLSEDFSVQTGVSVGLLKRGLGVHSRRVPETREKDTTSLAIEAVEKLRDWLGIDYLSKIKHVSVGTETRDHYSDDSKPRSSYLLPMLFSKEKPTEISEDERTYPAKASEEKFACLGALSRVVDYMGKKAVVVATDNAEYNLQDDPSAEGTAGTGAGAMAVGEGDMLRVPDFVVEGDLFGYSSSHTYDFSKPSRREGSKNVSSVHPRVDGKFSFLSYLKLVGEAYKNLKSSLELSGEKGWEPAGLDSYKGAVFHVPYPAMAEYALKYLRAIDAGEDGEIRQLIYSVRSFDEKSADIYGEVKGKLKEFSASDEYRSICDDDYKNKLADSLDYPSKVGNAYTASVFISLVSSLENGFDRGYYKAGDKILVLGYGSGGGAIAVPFVVTEHAADIVKSIKFREELARGVNMSRAGELSPYGWELKEVDENGKRRYARADAPVQPLADVAGNSYVPTNTLQ